MEGRTTLYWPNASTFQDNVTGERFEGEGAYEVPADEEAHYRRRGWEDVPEDFDGDVEGPANTVNPNRDEPTRDELRGQSPDDAPVDTSSGDEGDAEPEDSDFDADAVLEGNVEDVEERIQNGEADGHLGDLLEAASREGVKKAIRERQESG